MGPKERREREREDIRARILDAAREMFVAEGFDAVTMRKIAEKIEYSPTAIYFHFKDKDALFFELCQCDFRTLADELVKIADVPDPIERLRILGNAYLEFGLQRPNHYRMMFMTPHPPMTPEMRGSITAGNPEEDAYAFLESIVAEAIAKKKFRKGLKDVELLSQTIWAGVHGVISLQIAKAQDGWVDWRPFKKRGDMMIDAILHGLMKE